MRVPLVNHIVVRFDHVDIAIASDVFTRTHVLNHGDILSCEFIFRRSISFERFEQKFTGYLGGELGLEIVRLSRSGLRPILHVGVNDWYGIPFFITFGREFLGKLSHVGRGIEISFPSIATGDTKGWKFSGTFLRILEKYAFTLEIS